MAVGVKLNSIFQDLLKDLTTCNWIVIIIMRKKNEFNLCQMHQTVT